MWGKNGKQHTLANDEISIKAKKNNYKQLCKILVYTIMF